MPEFWHERGLTIGEARCQVRGARQPLLKLSPNVTGAAKGTKLQVDSILSHRMSFALLLTIVFVYYLFLLSNGTFQLFASEMLDRAFDNMLVHLLRGEFSVDRDAIGFEAFTRDGKT
jgi:hypothetical protein